MVIGSMGWLTSWSEWTKLAEVTDVEWSSRRRGPRRWQRPVQTFTTVSVLNVRSIGMSRITFPVESVTVPRHCSWHSPSEIPRRRQGGGLGSLQILSKTLRGEQVEGVPASRKQTTREMANATHLSRMSLSPGRPYPGQNDHAGADGDGGEA